MLKELLLYIIVFSSVFSFADDTYDASEFTERILLFETQAGDFLSDGILAHEIDRTLYASGVDVFEALGFKTEISIDAKLFKAESLSPKVEISLKWSDCSVLKNEEKIPIECGQFKIYEDEVYIELGLAEKLLESSLQYLPYKSELKLSTTVQYPRIDKINREKKKIKSSSRIGFDPGFERIHTGPQTFQNLFLDQQLSFKKADEGTENIQYYSNFSTDVLQHEVQITSRGDNESNDFTTWQVKRDFYGAEKNKYISTYQLGNIVIPTAELVGGPERGEGFYITNRDQNLISFGQRELEGNLRPDWEVELYLNGSLLERQTANEDGRYRFKNIPLQYGENTFRLEFYGPLGERKTEFINNNISVDSLKKGRFNYDVGLSQNDSGQAESLLQTSYGLTDSLSAYAGYTRYNLFKAGDLRDYAILGLNGYLKNLSYSTFSGFDFFNEAAFYALRSQFIIKNTRLQFTYLDSEGFKSEEIGTKNKFLDKSYKANLNMTLLGRASVFYRFEHNLFEDLTEETKVVQNLVLPIKRVLLLLQNDLQSGSDNKIDIIYTYLRNQFRTSLAYDLEEGKNISFEYRNRFKQESSISASYSNSFEFETELLRVGYQQRFNKFFVGVEASTDMYGGYSVGARLRSSFGYTKVQNKVQVSPDLIASRGNVCANVFEDFDRNGVLDPKIDLPIENVNLRWAQGNIKFKTDKNGRAYLGNLPMYTPVDIQLLVKSLEDPQLAPIKDGFRVHLQKGQCKELNFLIRKTYEYEGQVFFKKGQVIKRMNVQLLDAHGKVLSQVRTDREGYFLFESIPSRVYYMKVSDNEYIGDPEVYILNPYDPESFEQIFYFDVLNK